MRSAFDLRGMSDIIIYPYHLWTFIHTPSHSSIHHGQHGSDIAVSSSTCTYILHTIYLAFLLYHCILYVTSMHSFTLSVCIWSLITLHCIVCTWILTVHSYCISLFVVVHSSFIHVSSSQFIHLVSYNIASHSLSIYLSSHSVVIWVNVHISPNILQVSGCSDDTSHGRAVSFHGLECPITLIRVQLRLAQSECRSHSRNSDLHSSII